MTESQRAQDPTGPIRALVIATAIIAIVLGLMAIFLPGASLLSIAILFGIALIVAGINRLVVAFRASLLGPGMRVLLGILGALVVVAGIVCLVDPLQSLSLLAFTIGFAWIFEGVGGVLSGITGAGHGGRAYAVVAGVVSVLAGLAMFFLPGLALSAFVTVAGVILIVVGVFGLLHLPRRARA